LLGRTPHLVAAAAAFYSAKNEAAEKPKGVKRIRVPNMNSVNIQTVTVGVNYFVQLERPSIDCGEILTPQGDDP
jgi:hypothetical protein